MFVAQDLTVDVGSRVAQARFTNLLRGAWLTEASEAAYDGGLTGLLRVGPAGPVTAKLVRVGVLDPVYRGDVKTVGLRWEATGPAGSLFPVLDADVSISPVGEEGTAATESGRPGSRWAGPTGHPWAGWGQDSTGLSCTGSPQ